LIPEHVFKLVYIYFNYKLKKNDNIDDIITNRDEDIEDEGTITEGSDENGSV